jgi:hypothetical protein
MQPLCCWVSLLLVMQLFITTEGHSSEKFVNRAQVESLMSDYLNKLKDGNTSGVLDLLAGPMLKSNENLLQNNPGYTDLLKKRYENSSFVIGKFTRIDSSKSSVDVVIRLNTQEEIKVRFTLLAESDRLKICAEEDLNTVEGNNP